MPQKYKVYINDKVIIFRKSKTTFSVTENQLISVEPSPTKLKEIISDFNNNYDAKKLFIITTDLKNAFRLFSLNYTMVIAAGGVVRNPHGDVLCIFRNGKWDLPKGKQDPGEKPRQTALREVSEETGIKDLSVTKKLENSYHTYKEKKKLILKKTFWYEMSSNEENLSPQKEEGITEIRWVKTSEIDKIIENTFGSVSNLLAKYRKENRF
jgi:ADP-ribose pyrophosphatase YjhB (NUDIX family)